MVNNIKKCNYILCVLLHLSKQTHLHTFEVFFIEL